MVTLVLGAALGLQLSRASIDPDRLHGNGAYLWSTG